MLGHHPSSDSKIDRWFCGDSGAPAGQSSPSACPLVVSSTAFLFPDPVLPLGLQKGDFVILSFFFCIY